MSIVQLAPAASDEPQVLVCAKNFGDAVMLFSLRMPVPVFVSATGCGWLLVPTAWVPKSRLVADNEPIPLEIPVPCNAPVMG